MSRKSDFSVQNNVVSVCCSYLNMVFPDVGNVKYTHGRTDQQQQTSKRQRLRYISQNDRLPLVTLGMLSLEAARSFHSLGMILDPRFLESTNPDRIG